LVTLWSIVPSNSRFLTRVPTIGFGNGPAALGLGIVFDSDSVPDRSGRPIEGGIATPFPLDRKSPEPSKLTLLQIEILSSKQVQYPAAPERPKW